MKLGLIAFATNTGLGIQTKGFYDHMNPDKTMVIDLSELNYLPLNLNWYPNAQIVHGIPRNSDILTFLDGLDVVFLCETPLNYDIFNIAREKGIKTVLQYNYEFLDYHSVITLPKPTVFAAPSAWNIEKLQPMIFENVVQLPVPVDETSLIKRDITSAKTFFHIAGRPAIHDRNGTLLFIEAAKIAVRLEPGMKFVVYCQDPNDEIKAAVANSPIELRENVDNYADLYTEGDMLIMPRRYGGLCLPVNEAIYCGIPVLMPGVDPNNRWLPEEWLLPTETIGVRSFFTRTNIDIHDTLVNPLAQKMLDNYRHPEGFVQLVEQAKSIGETLTWTANLERYKTMLEEICTSALL